MVWKTIGVAFLALSVWQIGNTQASPESEAEAYETLAKSAFSSGDFAACAALYIKRHKLSPKGSSLFNAGLCLEKAGQLDEAIEAFVEYERFAPDGELLAEARTRRELLELKRAARKPDPPPPSPEPSPLPPPEASPEATSAAAGPSLTVQTHTRPSPPFQPAEVRPVSFGFFGYGLASGPDTGVRGLSFNLFPGYKHSVRGLEVGAMVNIVRGDVVGVQLCNAFNYVGGEITGFQFAVGFNRARVVRGVQVGLLGNFAESVHGLQVGILNYTRTLSGVQIGVFNVATKNWLPIMIGINAGY